MECVLMDLLNLLLVIIIIKLTMSLMGFDLVDFWSVLDVVCSASLSGWWETFTSLLDVV